MFLANFLIFSLYLVLFLLSNGVLFAVSQTSADTIEQQLELAKKLVENAGESGLSNNEHMELQNSISDLSPPSSQFLAYSKSIFGLSSS